MLGMDEYVARALAIRVDPITLFGEVLAAGKA